MKKFIIFICCFSLVICSCKTISNTNIDSDLTTLSISKEGLDVLNQKMSEKKYENINFVSLTLKKDQQDSACSQNQGLDKIDPSSSNNDITLKTRAPGVDPCTYELYMEYGVNKNNKYTVYFKGKTTVGTTTEVNGKTIDNTYKGKITPVQIPLTFIPEGTELTINAVDLNSQTTNVEINPTIVNANSSIKLIDLFDQKNCPFVKDIIGIDAFNKEHKYFLIKGDARQCINENTLGTHYNKREVISGGGMSAIDHIPFKDIKLESNTTYSVIYSYLGGDKNQEKTPQTKRGFHNDTIDVTIDNYITIKYYPFKYTNQEELAIGHLTYKTIIFNRKDK